MTEHLSPEDWFRSPDRGDGEIYVMSPRIEEAVMVALATGRPLLLRGRPGSGKSSLAPFIARQRGWRYYDHVITYGTRSTELLWRYDSVRRLADAQAHRQGAVGLDDASYVEPGVLWWALAPGSARRRGRAAGQAAPGAECPDPSADVNVGRSPDHAVVLIDEIDKADPDVPNSLLVPLGSHRFTVVETGTEVRLEQPVGEVDPRFSRYLVVITTNDERELPQAFLRRCVVETLPDHDVPSLVRIAEEHMKTWHGSAGDGELRLAEALAVELGKVREQAMTIGLREPSTAEFLDALRACLTLGITLGSERWEWLKNCVLIKRQQIAGDEW
ncbi:AAA family ATPase [Streptomyces sp. GQFP]|uniref:AAA family ATPase n=1 Tax=Streptomyces sp. GQFP TaxID=2907545 RepID=UPI001F352C2A|nr:MoxR family ATPase [Streptomyces sp. GQFP]UIX30073.1 MoxR family ATPase [Streptomyces sp. GQFP]